MKTELEYLYSRREVVKMDLMDIEARIKQLEKTPATDKRAEAIKAAAQTGLSKKIAQRKHQRA